MAELDSEGCAASGQAKTWKRRMPGMGAIQERRMPGMGAIQERMRKDEGAGSVLWNCKGFHFSLLQSIMKEEIKNVMGSECWAM